MKITVMGPGGVGGYFGARLAAAGNDVTFVARGSHLERPAERGVVEVARQLMIGAAYQYRAQQLRLLGLDVGADLYTYRPQRL